MGIDTSIPSVYFDKSKPIRQLITQKWFQNESIQYELYTSVVTIEEIDRLQNIEKREMIKSIILDYNVKILELSDQSIKLSNEYIKNGAIPKTETEDARHVAIASVNCIDLFASWNFKHLVSANPIKKIHEINNKLDYNTIEIGSLELFGGYKYGNL